MAQRMRVLLRAGAEAANAAAQFVAVMVERPDVVVASRPSLALGPVGLVSALLAGAGFVPDVRDLYWLHAGQLGKVPRRLADGTERLIQVDCRARRCRDIDARTADGSAPPRASW
jgi:hypothetical protein